LSSSSISGTSYQNRTLLYGIFEIDSNEIIVLRHQLKVSADLTGGVDSRLVCVLLHHHGVKYIRNRAKRMLKGLGRKLFQKTYLQESPEHPELFRKIRALPVTCEAGRRASGRAIWRLRRYRRKRGRGHTGSRP